MRNKINQIIEKIGINKIPEIGINKIPEIGIILFLFIFSLGLRLVYMNPGLFELDSIGLASAVETTFKTGTLTGLFNGRYGGVIVNMITYVPYHLITGVESSEKSIIFTEMLFASLGVVILFLFVQKLFSTKSISLVAALLFSISPIFLSVTTYGNSIGIEVFFILASFYLLAYFHKQNSQLHLVLSSVSIAFSVMVRESALVFIPLYFLFYINPIIKNDSNFIYLNQEVLKVRNLMSVFLPFLLTFGIYTYYVFHDVLYKTLFISDDGSGSIAVFMGVFSDVLNKSTSDLYFNLSVVGIVFVIGGLIISIGSFENKFYVIFFLLWSGMFFYFGNISTYSPYYLAIVSVPLYIFISVFLSYLYKTNRLFGVVCLSLLIFVPFSQIQPILDYRHEFSGEKEYALWVKEKIPPNSKVIVMNDAGFFNYYANLETLSHPIGDLEKTKTWIKETNLLLKNGTNIYIVSSAFSYDPDKIFFDALHQNFEVEFVDVHICEDYHKATINDTRYQSKLFKVNRIMAQKELLDENVTYRWNFTNKDGRVLFKFTNADDASLKNTKLRIDTMTGGEYASREASLEDINPGETKEIDIPSDISPNRIMIWNEDLESWIVVYRRYTT